MRMRGLKVRDMQHGGGDSRYVGLRVYTPSVLLSTCMAQA